MTCVVQTPKHFFLEESILNPINFCYQNYILNKGLAIFFSSASYCKEIKWTKWLISFPTIFASICLESNSHWLLLPHLSEKCSSRVVWNPTLKDKYYTSAIKHKLRLKNRPLIHLPFCLFFSFNFLHQTHFVKMVNIAKWSHNCWQININHLLFKLFQLFFFFFAFRKNE